VPVPDFHHADPGWETEKLEIWKTDIETGDIAIQNFRFSGFRPLSTPEILPNEPGWDGVGGETGDCPEWRIHAQV